LSCHGERHRPGVTSTNGSVDRAARLTIAIASTCSHDCFHAFRSSSLTIAIVDSPSIASAVWNSGVSAG